MGYWDKRRAHARYSFGVRIVFDNERRPNFEIHTHDIGAGGCAIMRDAGPDLEIGDRVGLTMTLADVSLDRPAAVRWLGSDEGLEIVGFAFDEPLAEDEFEGLLRRAWSASESPGTSG